MLAGWVTIVTQTQKQLEYQMTFFSFPNISFSLEFVSHCSIVYFLYWKLQTSKKAEGNCILEQVYVLYAEVAPRVSPTRWLLPAESGESGMFIGLCRVHDMVFMCHVCLPSWANLVLSNPGRGYQQGWWSWRVSPDTTTLQNCRKQMPLIIGIFVISCSWKF